MALGTDRGRPALTCAGCGVFLRLLQRRGEPLPAVDLDDGTADVPPVDCWWLAHVKGSDNVLRPVALAASLGSAWVAALSAPLRGPIIVVPTDPPPFAQDDAGVTSTNVGYSTVERVKW